MRDSWKIGSITRDFFVAVASSQVVVIYLSQRVWLACSCTSGIGLKWLIIMHMKLMKDWLFFLFFRYVLAYLRLIRIKYYMRTKLYYFFFYYTDTYLWNVRVCRIICAQLTYYSITIPLLILLFFFPSFSIFQCFFYSSDFFSPNCWWCFLLFLFIFFYVAVVYPKGNIL